ncbi:hypothetical protein EJ110_NYTH56271 [Nymphaea thermarum]|nr:hypothetical protein EJ110_NYTH56271 [Nymphaea thermarum]
MDYHSLSRKDLQALCKKHGIRANTSNATMADALQSLNIAQDSATEIGICDAVVLGNTCLNSPASVTTSCRRTPLRTSTRTMVRTTRTKRESEKAEEEEEDPKSPAAGGIENLEEASRSVAPSGRRIMTRSSARRQMEKIEIAEELITPAKAAVPLVPNSRRRPTRASVRQQTLREGAGQEETKGEKDVIDKLRNLSLSSTIGTRRSSRLRGKNQDSEVEQLEQKLEKKFIDERGTQQPDAVGEPDQEISEELSGEPSVTIREASSIEDSIRTLQLVKTPAPVSEKYKGEPSGQTMTQVPGVNETTALLKQSDQNVGGVGECLIDAGFPLCSDEKTHGIPAATETSVAQPEASADEAEKVIIDDVSASLGPDSDLRCINGEECSAPFPSLIVHGALPSSEADQVAVTTHEASTDAVMLSVEVPDEAQVGDQTTGTLGDLVKEKLHQPDALEAGDGCIAQEASLDPVLLLSSEPENNVGEPLPSDKDCDNLPATEEVIQFPGTAVTSYEASTDALEAGDGCIAQEASLDPVLLPSSEPENNVGEPLPSDKDCDNLPATEEALPSDKDCDNLPATEEVIQFPGTAVTSYEASTNAIMLSVEVSDEAQVVDQTAEGLANLEKEKLLPEDALEAVEGFIAQEASLNPVLLPGEPLSLGKDSDNIPAADEFLRFPGTASLEAWEVPSADLPHDPPVGELIATSAAVIPDEFLDELQQIEEVNEKSASLGSWSAASPIPASLGNAFPGSEFFVVPVADKSLQFPAEAQEAHFENTHHESLAVDLTATTTAVPDEVSAACLQIEEANEKSPSFGSWSAASRGSEFSLVRKSGKSRSSVGSCKGMTLGRIQMFTTAEACVNKENKLMNEENIVADKRLNDKSVGLGEFKNFSLRKLRIMVKEGIKNKVQTSERTPLETLSANCLGNENSEVA